MRFRTRRLAAALLVASLFSLPVSAYAQVAESPNSPSSTELVEEPARWDGKTVEFVGEAIFERMVRGDMAWLHLNDDAYYLANVEEGAPLGGYNMGMPVWVAADLALQVETFGDYKHQGDLVRVRGVFNAACAEHGGDMDIHATALDVSTPGRAALDPVKPWKVLVVAGLSLVAAASWLAERRVKASLRRGVVTGKRA